MAENMAVKIGLQNNTPASNGCIKLPDGTFIQWKTESFGSAPSNKWTNKTVNFDESFIAPPSVVANIVVLAVPRTELTGPNITEITASSFTARVRNDYSGTFNPEITWIAIGRWK